MTSEQEAMEAALKITGPCSCHEAYKMRSLIAPDCVFHDIADDIAEALVAAHRAGMEEAARIVETVGKDWNEDGQSQKVYACEYLVQQIRAAKEYRDE